MAIIRSLGIIDVIAGSGKPGSLKKFWLSSQDNADGLPASDVETLDIESCKSLLRHLNDQSKKTTVLWLGNSNIEKEFVSEKESIETSKEIFLNKIGQEFENIRRGLIDRLVVGAFKTVDINKYVVTGLVFGKTTEEEQFARLMGWKFSTTALEDLDIDHMDQFHEWTMGINNHDDSGSLYGKFRPVSSLTSSCALNAVIRTTDEVYHWIESIARASLALHHKIIPCGSKPSNDFSLPGDYVLFTSKTPWICSPSQPRSATCFLSQDNRLTALRLCESTQSNRPFYFNHETHLFVFSAPDSAGLIQKTNKTLELIREQDSMDLAILARRLSREPTFKCRLAISASNIADFGGKLEKALLSMEKGDRTPSRFKAGIAWNTSGTFGAGMAGVFPGQGSQRVNMLKELCLIFPKVRDWFDRLEEALLPVRGILPSLSIFPPSEGIDSSQRESLQTNFQSQEGGNAAVIIGSLALHELLQTFGYNPDVLVGHSSGEISAKIISGAIQFETREELFETILSVNKKGSDGNMRGEIPKGRFLAVTTFEELVIESFIQNHKGVVFLAMDNCPQQKVLFLPDELYESLYAELIDLGVICLPLYFDRAYHTPLFEVEMESIRTVYDGFTFHTPKIPIFSCINLANFPDDPVLIKKWFELNWTHCVKFKDASVILHERGIRLFLEIGTGGILSGFVDNTLSNFPHKAIPLDKEGHDSFVQLMEVLGTLFVEGVDLKLENLFWDEGIPDDPKAELEKPVLQGAIKPSKISMPQTFPSMPLLSENSTSAAIVMEHFVLMKEYLRMESEIFKRVLKSKSVVMSSPSISSAPTFSSAPIYERSVVNLPMVDTIISLDQHNFSAERTINRENDLFLQHHTLGRFILKKPINAAPLPLMPLAMTMEMMAEGASLMAPDNFIVSEIVNLKAMRWLTIDEESLTITISGKSLQTETEGEYHIFVSIQSKKEPNLPYCTATVVLKATYSTPPMPMVFSAPKPKSPLWDADSFFEQCLFHGESFSSMDALLGHGEESIEVALSAPRSDILFKHQSTPIFKIPAQLLDVPGHTTAWWKVEHGDEYFGIFPISIERIHFFSQPPDSFTFLKGRGVNSETGHLITSNFEILQPNEKVLLKIDRFQFIHYKFELSFLKSHYWNGPNTFFSKELPIDHPDIIGFQADTPSAGFFEEGGGVWFRSLVHMYCNLKEKKQWLNLTEKGKRREQWLLGRIAAKEIVRKWALQFHCIYVLCPDIEIATTSKGKPFVICNELEQLGPLPDISITHSGPRAIALLANSGFSVGVDLEYLNGNLQKDSPGAHERLEIAFDEKELYALNKNGISDLHVLVSAKEAASKATGIGFLSSMSEWKVQSFEKEAAVIRVTNKDIPVSIICDSEQILSYCLIPQDVAESIHNKLTVIETQ